jgi:putative transposase
MKFRFMLAEKAHFSIVFMCRMLEVSRSGYYAWFHRGESARVKDDRAMGPLIHAEFNKYPRGCGSRVLVGALRDVGRGVSRRRVTRLMAQQQLCHRLKRRFRHTTDSRHKKAIAPNVLDRNFAVRAPNKAWVADITYFATRFGWAYLAVILDLGSRRVVGWKVSSTMDLQLVVDALEQATQERRPPPGLIHHSDRGVQYAADCYQALLGEHGMVCSMSRKGNCWDNAVAESFFSSLKRELPNEHLPRDAREVEQLVFAYINAHYNTNRRHSALGYISPNQYERNAA